MESMLQIIESCERGGAEKHTRLITKAFHRLGYPSVLLYAPGPYGEYFEALKKEGVECIEYPMRKNLLKTILYIRALVKRRTIRYIHSHQHWADFFATCATLGMKDVVRFSTIHFLPGDIPRHLARYRAILMTLLAFHTMKKVFAVSTEVAHKAQKALWLSKDKVVVTLNSIDFDEMAPDNAAVEELTRTVKPGGEKVILCVGFLHDRKGQKYAIEALELLGERAGPLKLVLLGEGDMENELKQLVREKQLESKVVFKGYTPNVADWMSIADIYIQPSLIDPLPRALLEAMYMGLPVAASRLKTMSEVVRDKETGLALEPASSDALADAIGYFLENRDEAVRMGKNAQAFVRENCSMESMAEKIMAALE